MNKRCEFVPGLGIRILRRCADCFLLPPVIFMMIFSPFLLTRTLEEYVFCVIGFSVLSAIVYIFAWLAEDSMGYLYSITVIAGIKKFRKKICVNG